MKSPLRTLSFHSWEEREVCRRGPVVSALTAGWNKPRLLQYRSFGRMCCVCEINGDTWMTLHSTPPSLTPSQTLRLLWISCLAEVNRDMRAGTAVSNCSQQPSAIAAYHTPKSVISPLLSSRPGIYEKVQRKMLSENDCLSSAEMSRITVFQENAPDRFHLCQHCQGRLMRGDMLNCLKCKCPLHFSPEDFHSAFKWFEMLHVNNLNPIYSHIDPWKSHANRISCAQVKWTILAAAKNFMAHK